MLSAIAAAVLASVPFTSNYTPGLYPGFSGGALRIDGWEPAEDGSFPVVLFFGPTGFSPDRNLAVVKGLSVFPVFEGGLTEHLPDCGFIVAAVEYPSYSEYIATCDYLIEKAESLFTEPGNPFEQICSRPKADCSQGVGLVGVSQGAHFASLAATLPGLAYEVTAALSVAGGTKFTAPPLEDGPEYECLSNETLSAHLPSTKRRSIVSGSDAVFGTTVDEVLRQQKELTGYDCGTELNCIQEDGSGYIVRGHARTSPPHCLMSCTQPSHVVHALPCGHPFTALRPRPLFRPLFSPHR
jgi:hypothetical protein